MIQRLRQANIINPGANSSVDVYDDVTDPVGSSTNLACVKVRAFLDQDFTINTYWAATQAGPLRLVATDSYAAGVDGHVGAVHAAQPITCVAKASLTDNDYFTLVYTTVIDGATVATTVIFEYKVTGGFVATVGRTTIDVTAATTDVSVAVLTATAIRTACTALTVPVPTTATLTASVTQSGARFALSATENVTNGGFSIGTAVAGVEGSVVNYTLELSPGRNKVGLVTGTIPLEFDVAVELMDDVSAGGIA